MATYEGSPGNDTFVGDGADDVANGNGGNDFLIGEGGNDQIDGGADNDDLHGGPGNDTLIGGTGHDGLTGGSGVDNVQGGEGDDYLYIQSGDLEAGDVFDGGNGFDELAVSPGVDITTANFINMEAIRGSNVRLTLAQLDVMQRIEGGFLLHDSGSISFSGVTIREGTFFVLTGANTFNLTGVSILPYISESTQGVYVEGGAGADTITGSSLDDELRGGGGNDVLNGGAGDGADILRGEDGDDTLNGGGGNDQLFGGADTDELNGGDGNDQLSGGAGADVLNGGGGDDSLFIDSTDGLAGEQIDGGTGTDTLVAQGDISDVALSGIERIDANGQAIALRIDQLAGITSLRASVITLTTGGSVSFGYAFEFSPTFFLAAADTTLDFTGATANFPFIQVYGNSGNDMVIGGVDTIFRMFGEGGNDTLRGNNTNDSLDGGADDDQLFGGGGNDGLVGGEGNDLLEGGAGDDGLEGLGGNDTATYANAAGAVTANLSAGTASGADGNDTLSLIENLIGSGFADGLTGDGEANQLFGGGGNDTLHGLGNDDWLDGGTGADTMYGETGNDTFVVDNASDVVIEAANEGTDTVRTALASYTLAANVENLIFTGTGGFTGTGNGEANTLTGGGGDDTLDGGDGNDTLDGGAGADDMTGGTGDDTYVVDDAGDTVHEEPNQGNDTVLSSIDYVLGANVENLTLTGEAQIGTGNELDNVIIGNEGDNWIDGGAGADRMEGGEGENFYIVDNVGDQVIQIANSWVDTVRTSLTSYALTDNVERLVYTGTLSFNGTGTAQKNFMAGGVNADTLTGGAGDDVYLVNHAGDQVIELAGGGFDTVQTSVATYVFAEGSEIERVIYTGGTNFFGRGNSSNNVIQGGVTGDVLIGLGGADTLIGLDGNDFLYSGGSYSGDTFNERDDGTEHDVLQGGGGDDYLSIGWGDDASNAARLSISLVGAGTGVTLNTADLMSGTPFVLGGGTIQNIDSVFTIWGTAFADNLTIAGSTIVHGGAGNDTVTSAGSGGGTGVHFYTGSGNDTFIGAGNRNDIVTAESFDASDSLDGGAGIDTLNLASGFIGANVTNFEILNAGDVSLTMAQLDQLIQFGGTLRLTTSGTLDLTGVQVIVPGGGVVGSHLYLAPTGDNIITLPGVGTFLSVWGGTGNDTITGGVTGTVDGGGGNDTITGVLNGSNYFRGGAGNDTLIGGNLLDSLSGGSGIDDLQAGGGDDELLVTNAADVEAGDKYDGGSGYDTMSYIAAGNILDLSGATITGVEFLHGGYADAEARMTIAQFKAFEKTDMVIEFANGGTVLLAGEIAKGQFRLSNTATVFDATGVSLLQGGAYGNLDVQGGNGNDSITGYFGDDALSGGEGNDKLYGMAGADSLYGNGGNDELRGGVGIDNLHGGTGNDLYFVDDGDLVFELDGEGDDTVSTTLATLTLAANVERLTYTGAGAFDGIGNGIANILTGGGGADRLRGLGGNDTLYGMGGNDRLEGGEGNDILDGGTGRDMMSGGIGDDTYIVDDAAEIATELANEGTDLVKTAVAAYTLGTNVEDLLFMGSGGFAGTGNASNNVLDTRRASGNDTLLGLGGNDTLFSGAGNDTLDGGTGRDVMYGGAGDDFYIVDDLNDSAHEALDGGIDTIRSSVNHVLGNNVENLTLIGGAVIGTGNGLDNVIIGNGSNNQIDGSAGADRMEGGIGDDTYRVDNANDLVIEGVNAGLDTVIASVSYTLRAGVSVETLTTENDAGTAARTLTGNELNNRIIGNAGDNTLNGGAGDDRLEGLGGSDTLNGGAGADRLIGGAGNDLYVVSDLLDTITELAGGGLDYVSLSLAAGGIYTLASEVDNVTVLSNNTEAHGNGIANQLVSVGSGNSLWGEGGNDRLIGGINIDLLHGGSGNDSITGGAGNDRLWGDAGADLFVFASGSGADEIVDFARGSDRIDLKGWGISSYAQLQAMMSQNGADTVIDLGGGHMITLDGITASQLAASDFVLL